MKKAFFGALLMIFSGSLAVAVMNSPVAEAKDCSKSDYVFGLPTWYRGLTTGANCEMKKISEKGEAGSVTIQTFIWQVVGNVFDMIFRLAGVIAVGFIVWAGFQYMLALGNSGQLANAKTTLINAIIGLIITLLASGIINLAMGIFK